MRVDIKGAVASTGLTEYAIRKMIWAKKIPYFTTGGGTYIFDTELLNDAIKNIMLKNMEGGTNNERSQ